MPELKVTSARSILGTQVLHAATPVVPSGSSKLGATGERVRQLQACLKALGYNPGPINGKFDARTDAALKAFQKASGIPQHGIAGATTREALAKAVALDAKKGGPTLKANDSGNAVRRLEQKLAKAGLLSAGKVDDKFDAATVRAVKAFERKNGLKEDGVVGEKEWNKLGGSGGGSGPRLKNGDTGAAVRALQTELKEQGLYDGPVDGKFTAATGLAVRRLERQNGQTVDGITDAGVWKKLQAHVYGRQTVGGPVLAKGYRGQAVSILQRKLREKGLYTGAIDGKFGDTTETAVRRFQRRNGMNITGRANNALWVKLGGAGLGSGPRLKEGSTGDAVKLLQRRLKDRGLYSGDINGRFGASTRRGLVALEKKLGQKADGVADIGVWRALGRHAVTAPDSILNAPEPKHDYRIVTYNGARMNVRTKIMLQRAEAIAKKMGVRLPMYVTQGSYSTSVSASGGTHDGGGALDIRTRDRSRAEVLKMVKAMRLAGFAAWKRGYGGDSFTPHIHAIAIGDRKLSSSARNQVTEYFRGGDGLVGSVPDGDARVGWPRWANKYR